MCIMCKDWILEKLNIVEIRRAASELVQSADTIEDAVHVMDRLREIEDEYEDGKRTDD